MRQLAAILFLYGIGFAASAQTSAPLASAVPSAASTNTAADASTAPIPEPLSTTESDNTRYINDPNLLNDCTARLSAFDDKPCDIIFIGDSITANWLTAGKGTWDALYAPRHALDFGVSGDKTQNVLWRLTNMSIQNLKPKVAVVLIGTNNTMNTAHEIADGIKAVLANTQEAFPGVKIILVSILPSERENDKMMQANALIKGNDDGQSVYFLNLVPLMPLVTKTLPNGKLESSYKGIGPDGLHPDAGGYQTWAGAMEPLISKLLQ